MGGSLGKSKNKGSQQGSFEQNVWGPWGGAWGNMAGAAGDVGDWSTGNMMGQAGDISGQIGGVADQMNPAWGQQLAGGAYAGVDAGAIQDQLIKSMQQPSESGKLYGDIMAGSGNAYLGGMQDQMKSNAYDTMMGGLKGIDARAAASGMSGGSRHGLAQSGAIKGAQEALMNNMTDVGYQSFDKDLQNKLGIAGMADQNNLARQQMMNDMLAGKQAAMSGGLGFGNQMQGAYMGQMSPYMSPWQSMGQWAGALGGPVMEGSGSSVGSSKGKGFGISGGK